MKRLITILLFIALLPSTDWAADHAGWTAYSITTSLMQRCSSDSTQGTRFWNTTIASDASNEVVAVYNRWSGADAYRVISTDGGSTWNSANILSTTIDRGIRMVWPYVDSILWSGSVWADATTNHPAFGFWKGTTFASDNMITALEFGGSGGLHVGGFCLSGSVVHYLGYYSGDSTMFVKSDGSTIAGGTEWSVTEKTSVAAVFAYGYGQVVPWKNGCIKFNTQGGIFTYHVTAGVDTATVSWGYTTGTNGVECGRVRCIPYGAQETADSGFFAYQYEDGGVSIGKLKVTNEGDGNATATAYNETVILDSTIMPATPLANTSRNRVACPDFTWMLNSDGTPTDTCLMSVKKFPDTSQTDEPELWGYKIVWAKGSALAKVDSFLIRDDATDRELMNLTASPKAYRQAADSSITVWYMWEQMASAGNDTGYIGKLKITSIPASTGSLNMRRRHSGVGSWETPPVEKYGYRGTVILDLSMPTGRE